MNARGWLRALSASLALVLAFSIIYVLAGAPS